TKTPARTSASAAMPSPISGTGAPAAGFLACGEEAADALPIPTTSSSSLKRLLWASTMLSPGRELIFTDALKVPVASVTPLSGVVPAWPPPPPPPPPLEDGLEAGTGTTVSLSELLLVPHAVATDTG